MRGSCIVLETRQSISLQHLKLHLQTRQPQTLDREGRAGLPNSSLRNLDLDCRALAVCSPKPLRSHCKPQLLLDSHSTSRTTDHSSPSSRHHVPLQPHRLRPQEVCSGRGPACQRPMEESVRIASSHLHPAITNTCAGRHGGTRAPSHAVHASRAPSPASVLRLSHLLDIWSTSRCS